MEKINLHFTGDFHAITAAHNMISALLDNYIYQNQKDGFALKEVLWKRVLDVNDRSLRSIVTGLGPRTNGLPAESGFDITPASELMAILCLSTDLDDMRRRIDNILLGYKLDDTPFCVKDLGITGAILVLLETALEANLVQTTEGTAAFVHGGPFANIAHGCNSIIATKTAMSLGEYVVTEAGFGADLGAEKFYNIKCRKAGITPKLTVLVVTARALKMHGGVSQDVVGEPNLEALKAGIANMDKHLDNIASFGQTAVVAFNRYGDDVQEEIEFVRQHCAERGVGFAVNNAFVEGGEGAVELAELVVKTIEENPSKPMEFTYSDNDEVQTKITKVARNIYGARQVNFSAVAKKKLAMIEESGYSSFPVCIAKTQYSFSTNPKLVNVPKDFEFNVQDIVINSGAEMLVVISGDIMRMPGLPKSPQALRIDIVDGEIEGLS
jgi:formate--tetrahydrofolate ligase